MIVPAKTLCKEYNYVFWCLGIGFIFLETNLKISQDSGAILSYLWPVSSALYFLDKYISYMLSMYVHVQQQILIFEEPGYQYIELINV